MKKHLSISLSLLIAFFTLALYAKSDQEKIDLGKFDKNKLQQIITVSSYFKDEGEKVDYVSSKFLDVPYVEDTLTGNEYTKEIFTVDLAGVDCFTYLDYVEALSISDNYGDFFNNLKLVRYRNGVVDFKFRNHFFSDWAVYNNSRIKDVTKQVSGDKVISKLKHLNRKSTGDLYLPGIPVVDREIFYIPSERVDDVIKKNLRDGDYVGFYTDTDGLDVSHTGIIIKNRDKLLLRHASSKEVNRKVVEEDFISYIKSKPGIVVFRADKSKTEFACCKAD